MSSMSSPSSPFQHARHRAAAGPAPSPSPSAEELAELRGTTVRLAGRFAVANAAFLGVMVLLACTAEGLLGVKVVGRLNLGMLLGLVQGVLLMGTAVWFERSSARVSLRAAGRAAGRTGIRDTDGQGPGGVRPDAWSAPTHQPYQSVQGRPTDGRRSQLGAPPPAELYERWDSYLYAGDRPDVVRPADNGPVGR